MYAGASLLSLKWLIFALFAVVVLVEHEQVQVFIIHHLFPSTKLTAFHKYIKMSYN